MVDVNKRLDRLDKNFDRLSIALKRANSRTQFVINYSLTGILGFASLAVTFLAILLGVNLYQQHKQKEQMDKYIDRVEINLDRVKINLEKFEEESHDLLNQNKRMLEIQGYAFYSDQVPKLVNIYERIMHNVSTSLPVEKLYQEYHLNAAKESLDGYVTWYEKMYGKTPFASKIIESIKSLRDLFKELEILVWVERSLNTPREIAVSKAILEAWQQSPGPRVDFSGSLSSFGKTRLPAYRDNVEGVLQLINCTSLENDDKKTIEYIDCLKKAEEHFIGASKKYPEFTRPYSNMASVYDKLIQQMRIRGTASGLRCEDLIEFYEVAQQLQKKASTLAKNPRSRSLALNNLAYFYLDEADLINSMSKENGSCQPSVKNGTDQDE